MGQSRPLFVYFCSFLVTISTQIEKKHRWYAWDSNLGPQDGRRRRIHGAMAATPLEQLLLIESQRSVVKSMKSRGAGNFIFAHSKRSY